jgi:hypothetical protein
VFVVDCIKLVHISPAQHTNIPNIIELTMAHTYDPNIQGFQVEPTSTDEIWLFEMSKMLNARESKHTQQSTSQTPRLRVGDIYVSGVGAKEKGSGEKREEVYV